MERSKKSAEFLAHCRLSTVLHKARHPWYHHAPVSASSASTSSAQQLDSEGERSIIWTEGGRLAARAVCRLPSAVCRLPSAVCRQRERERDAYTRNDERSFRVCAVWNEWKRAVSDTTVLGSPIKKPHAESHSHVGEEACMQSFGFGSHWGHSGWFVRFVVCRLGPCRLCLRQIPGTLTRTLKLTVGLVGCAGGRAAFAFAARARQPSRFKSSAWTLTRTVCVGSVSTRVLRGGERSSCRGPFQVRSSGW